MPQEFRKADKRTESVDPWMMRALSMYLSVGRMSERGLAEMAVASTWGPVGPLDAPLLVMTFAILDEVFSEYKRQPQQDRRTWLELVKGKDAA